MASEKKMSEPTFRRRRYLIDAPLQLGLSARVLLWGTAYLLLFVGLLFVPAVWDGVFGDGEMRVFSAVLDRLEAFAEYNFVALFAVLSLFVLHMIRFTHRFAGPMVRFRRCLQDISRGVYAEDLRLRRHDFLKDLAREFTATLAALREQSQSSRRINAATQKAARRLLQAATEADVDPEQLVLLAHEVLAAAETLDRHLPHVGETTERYTDDVPTGDFEDSVPATDEVIAGPVGG